VVSLVYSVSKGLFFPGWGSRSRERAPSVTLKSNVSTLSFTPIPTGWCVSIVCVCVGATVCEWCVSNVGGQPLLSFSRSLCNARAERLSFVLHPYPRGDALALCVYSMTTSSSIAKQKCSVWQQH